MKLAFDTSVVSSMHMAVVLWLLTATACIAGWPLDNVVGRLVVAGIGIITGSVLAGKRIWLVRHPAQEVLRQVQSTLGACNIAQEVAGSTVRVTSTGTKAIIRGWSRLSLVFFNVTDPRCKKERFLLEVLTKDLRLIGRKDAHG